MRAILTTSVAVAAVIGLSACGFGEEGITISESEPEYKGAQLFSANCSGCHTLSAAGAEGTGNRSARVQGPNLDELEETEKSALFAIQNGGFSGAVMPQNIVVGDEAAEVAGFVAKYSGSEAGDE